MTAPLRILRAFRSVDPRGGGPVEGAIQVSRVLARQGHHIEAVTLDAPGAPWLQSFPFPLHALGAPNAADSEGAAMSYGYSPQLVPWLQQHAADFDAVIVHGLWQFHGRGTAQALRGTKTPFFVYPHGMLDPWFKTAYPRKHLKKSLYWLMAEARVLREARAVCFTCEEERLLARQSFRPYRVREAVVAYGTAAPQGDANAQRAAFLEQFPALRDKRLLLFLSRIHPKKGCDLVIEAFARVAQHDESLHLVMAGPDQSGWKAQLEAQAAQLGIADRVTWPGMLSGDEKWGAYRSAEAFVLPSHQENFGIVVAEALACGVPVLLSDKVNIWREIEAAQAGFVAPDTATGAHDLLQRWLQTSPGARQQMGENARCCFAENFEIERAAQSLLELISSRITP